MAAVFGLFQQGLVRKGLIQAKEDSSWYRLRTEGEYLFGYGLQPE